MKKAWIENEIIRDICQGVPAETYHHDVSLHYTANVPDNAANGDGWDGTTLTKPVIVALIPPTPTPPQLTPIEFKMCFTSLERIALAEIRKTDAILADAYSILEDPRLKYVDMALQSNRDMIDYMVAVGGVTAERAVEIKAGKLI